MWSVLSSLYQLFFPLIVVVGWLDQATWWWRGLEIDINSMDDQRGRRGGGEIGFGLSLGFALSFCCGDDQLRFSLFLHSDSLRLGLGIGFALIFCCGYSVYLQVHSGGSEGLLWWWWRWVHCKLVDFQVWVFGVWWWHRWVHCRFGCLLIFNLGVWLFWVLYWV